MEKYVHDWLSFARLPKKAKKNLQAPSTEPFEKNSKAMDSKPVRGAKPCNCTFFNFGALCGCLLRLVVDDTSLLSLFGENFQPYYRSDV